MKYRDTVRLPLIAATGRCRVSNRHSGIRILKPEEPMRHRKEIEADPEIEIDEEFLAAIGKKIERHWSKNSISMTLKLQRMPTSAESSWFAERGFHTVYEDGNFTIHRPKPIEQPVQQAKSVINQSAYMAGLFIATSGILCLIFQSFF